MTRTMDGRIARGLGDICDLSDTCVSHEHGVDEVMSKRGDKSTEELNGVEPQRLNEPDVFDIGALSCDRQELILEQGADPKLMAARTAVLTEDEIKDHIRLFYVQWSINECGEGCT